MTTAIPAAERCSAGARPPRVLQIFSEYRQPGGEASSVNRISASLHKDLDLHHCFFSNAEWTGRDAPNILRQAVWMMRNPKSLDAVRRKHREVQPDAWLLHNVFPVGSAAIYREAGRLGVPVIQYIHNYRPFSINGYFWAGNNITTGSLPIRFLREIRHGSWQNSPIKTAYFGGVLGLTRALGWWRSVRAWIAISDFVREQFISFGIPPEDIFTLRHSWSPRPRSTEPVSQSHYLFLGRLIEAKGVLTLLHAWGDLERQLGAACPTLLIAGSGPLERRVRDQANATAHVRFMGRLEADAKRDAIAGARAVIVPSLWWEPLGLVVYEAYEAARPVLAASSGGLTETVIHRQTGLLHRPGDFTQLAEDVRTLERDVEFRGQMGRNCREWLEANTGETQWTEKFRVVLEYATR